MWRAKIGKKKESLYSAALPYKKGRDGECAHRTLRGRKRSRDGAVVRALASHQSGPGSIPARCHMWVEFVVSSRPCSEGFSQGSPVFFPPQIPIRSG